MVRQWPDCGKHSRCQCVRGGNGVCDGAYPSCSGVQAAAVFHKCVIAHRSGAPQVLRVFFRCCRSLHLLVEWQGAGSSSTSGCDSAVVARSLASFTALDSACMLPSLVPLACHVHANRLARRVCLGWWDRWLCAAMSIQAAGWSLAAERGSVDYACSMLSRCGTAPPADGCCYILLFLSKMGCPDGPLMHKGHVIASRFHRGQSAVVVAWCPTSCGFFLLMFACRSM